MCVCTGASIRPGGRCTFSIEIDPPVPFAVSSAGSPSAVFAASSFSSAVRSSRQNESRSSSSVGDAPELVGAPVGVEVEDVHLFDVHVPVGVIRVVGGSVTNEAAWVSSA